MPTLATIATKINNYRMDVPSSNFVPHQGLQIYPANTPTTLNQEWTLVSNIDGVPVPNGYVNIFAGNEPSNHLCIDVPNGVAQPEIEVQLYPINRPGGTANQQWKLIPVPGLPNWVFIASALDNSLVLDVRGGSGAAHTPIQIYTRGNEQPNQIWFLNPV